MSNPLTVPDHHYTPIADGTAVLRHDGFDVAAWGTARALVPEAGSLAARTDPRTAEGLTRDVFWSLHQPVPQLEPNAPLAPGYEFNQALLGELMATAEWTALRDVGTVGDELTAGLGAARATAQVLASLPPAMRDALNREAQAGREALAIEDATGALEDLRAWLTEVDPTATNPQYDPARATCTLRIPQMQQAAAATQAKAAAAGQQVAALAPDALDAARAAGRAAATDAAGEIREMQALARTFGGWDDSPAKREKLPADQIPALARAAAKNPVLRDIAAILGRMENIALRVNATRTDRPPTEVVGIELGREIPQLLPSAWALLDHPATRPLFYKGYVARELPQYELRGSAPQGQGTMILAIDQSGSMTGPTAGSPLPRRAWAAAVEIALLQIAARDQRDAVSLHFSTDLHERVYPAGTAPDVLALAMDFLSGGTDYAPWMRAALRRLRESRFANADVVILSDGDVSIPGAALAEWKTAKLALGFKCVAVLIGTAGGAAELARIADAVIPIASFGDDGPVLERLFAV